ncbi:TetR family transcriptional regulator [Dongia mobilis]|uniref:TetR family transcriptional regulator n=1 Tax=Dongia mobilis TaxID=578943 RepID=A0A4R6WXC5_9PROT|nr:TetR family transcriptional regulator [Dongia mobilis]TDQ84073.1 TetR family transcriptional regulator [Dongia mobilis]
MSRHQANRAVRRQNLIEAANAVMAARGFRGAGIAEIAAAAGIAPANLYRYFATKEDLVLAIVMAQRAEIGRCLAEARQGARGARDALRRFMTAMTRAAIEPRMRAMWLEILAEAARNPRIAQMLAADDAVLAAAFRELIEAGRAAGEIAAGADSPVLAHLLIALMDGAMARAGYDAAFDLDAFLAAGEALLFAQAQAAS